MSDSAASDQPQPNPNTPPVTPAELRDAHEEGVLFSDPDLTAWWWATHDFLSASERLQICVKALPLCTSRRCIALMTEVRDELEQYTAPISTVDAIVRNTSEFVRERPLFSLAIVVSMVWMLLMAGGNIYSAVMRVSG